MQTGYESLEIKQLNIKSAAFRHGLSKVDV